MLEKLELAIEELESNMSQLQEASDLAPKISLTSNHLKSLKSIVHETLTASVHLSANKNNATNNEDEEVYNRLLADLMILDASVAKDREEKFEKECGVELGRLNEIGSVEEIYSVINLITKK